MERYLCIHGHFYQPPRENPWLEDVELQDSAHPFHDWNERITAECYEPNATSRIVDGEGKILDILDNYSRVSFNFGPTLLSWMEKRAPEVYRTIIESDRRSRERFSGHGSAMAQAHGHLIMPLCNSRDKRTQVLWGIRDFRHRFGRDPEGMWLPETAVDLETLDLMAQMGILFTILAPHQAKAVRRSGDRKWQEVDGSRIDPKIPYLCRLPSGRTITLFFYDGPVSQEVAFSGLLKKGEYLAGRLMGLFRNEPGPQMVHIATDGETYGHHHKFGDMALAYCLHHVETGGEARLTVYGEFLEKHPPVHEVEIFENTAWSCSHGVERWRADCGCRIGGNDWNQAWRAPLREALDWLRDSLAPHFQRDLGRLLPDPWGARDDYIEVLLDRSPENVQSFLRRQAGRELNGEETVQALKLLEMQRQAMLMFTSCGWFFDEISGIESTQILCYASRAIQLAEEACGARLEEEFLRRLARAPSNLPEWRNGAQVYETAVRPVRLDLIRVAAHQAIAALFENGEEVHRVYCYTAQNEAWERIQAGVLQLAIGRTRIRSDITGEEGVFTHSVLHLGAQNLNAGVRRCRGGEAYQEMRREMREAFERSDIPEIIRLMDQHFETHNYTLWHLFRDEQRKILGQVMSQTLEDIEGNFLQIYNSHFTLVRFLRGINMPVPAQLALPMEITLNSRLRRLLEEGEPDPAHVRSLGEDMQKIGVKFNEKIRLAAGILVARRLRELAADPGQVPLLDTLVNLLQALHGIPLPVDLWKAQNLYFKLHRKGVFADLGPTAGELFLELGRKLWIKVD